MGEMWIHNKFPKHKTYGLIALIAVANLLCFLTMIRLQGEGGTPTGGLFNLGLAIFFQIVGWGLPLAVYLLSPLKVSIHSYYEIKVMNRLGRVKTHRREQIHKVDLWQEPMTKQQIYVIYHDREHPEYSFGLDLKAGKAVWDWYYNEGDWKKNP